MENTPDDSSAHESRRISKVALRTYAFCALLVYSAALAYCIVSENTLATKLVAFVMVGLAIFIVATYRKM